MAGTKHNEQDQHRQREVKPAAGRHAQHRSDHQKELKDENRTGTEGRHGRNLQTHRD